TNGKVSRGEEVVVLARTHHPLPPKLAIHGRLGAKDFSAEHPISVEGGVAGSLVPRLWASEYIHRLIGSNVAGHRAQVLELGLEYGLITPYTSSLALDSEAAYAAQGVHRRSSPLRGVRLTSIADLAGASDLASGVPARSLAGCNGSPAPTEMKERQGATGTRAKGEESAVAMSEDHTAGRYGVAGPAAQNAATAAPSVDPLS